MDTELTRLPWVLMYHSVEDYAADPYQVTVRPQRLHRQLDWLRRRGLRGVSVAELLGAQRTAGLVGLTFDDGYTDFLTEALPALQRHGFTATVYAVAGALGGHNTWDEPGPRKSLLTAEELRKVAEAGMEVGSHSRQHLRLTGVSDEELAAELVESRRILADVVGRAVTGFCYPYGDHGAREVAAVRAAGYDHAVATRPTPLAGRYALPRTFAGDRDTSPRLYAKRLRHQLIARQVMS